jgi:hypothetical protein
MEYLGVPEPSGDGWEAAWMRVKKKVDGCRR